MELSEIINVVVKLGMAFLFLTLMGLMYNMIIAITNWVNAKTKKEDLYIQLETNPDLDKKEHITFDTKIEVTVALLNIINILIDAEINRTIETVSMLGNKYELLKYDDDAKRISSSVFNAFDKESTFLSNKLMITDEYIMTYITEEVLTRLLRRAREYNLDLVQSE